MNKLYALTLLFFVFFSPLFGQITIKDGDLQGGNTYTWTKDNVYFFATRVWKYIEITNEDFMACRKNITFKVMESLGFIESK